MPAPSLRRAASRSVWSTIVSKSAIPGSEWRETCLSASSSPSTAPTSMSADGALAWPSCGAWRRATAGRCISRARSAGAPTSFSAFRQQARTEQVNAGHTGALASTTPAGSPSEMSHRPKRARRPRKTLVSIVIAILALGAGAWYFSQRSASADAGAWRTVEVEEGDIRVAISATGTLSAISTVVVGSQISGQVTEVLVDFNDKVEQGQVLARIDPSSYQAQIEQGSAQIASARASLAQAQATLRNAELDHRRKAELGERQLVARSGIDLSRAALDQARAQVASAQAQITQQTASTRTTRINLQRTVIRSPVDGVVLTRTIEAGQTVAASLQAPELFTIAEDLSKMKIELAVDEADIGQVQVGQRGSCTADAFADRQFRGVVDQVR